jgi:hypothetical protein
MRIAAITLLILTGGLCARADRIVESSWDVGLDGWTAGGGASVNNTSGFLEMNFAKQTAPSYSAASITKDVATGYRPNHISFLFRAPELVPSVLRVYLQSSSGRSWYKNFTVPSVGEWARFNVIVDFDSGWILGPISTKADFEADMDTITKVSLHLVRNGTTRAHAFNVDDFVVDAVPLGSALPEDNDGDGMLDAWEIANGLDPGSAEDADADDDLDGLSNMHEYLAGTDPQDPSSTLSLAIGESIDEQMQAVGFVLTWPSAPGKQYQIWKATNLISGFYMLQGGILATPPVNVYVGETDVLEQSSFYKIELE